MTEAIRCYLGLGSNLASPERQLRQAIHKLQRLPRTVLKRCSSIYHTEPYGRRAQPPYQNMVVELYTSLPAERLLHLCQQIENKQGRVRKVRWGARTLDIDILFYGNHRINTPTLTVPHPGILLRDFVSIPLSELTTFVIPHVKSQESVFASRR